VALVINAQPDLDIPDAVGVWLDLDRGVCREAKVVDLGATEQAPFVLTADYARWKEILRRELGPIAGIMQRKVALKGSLPVIVRFVKAAEELVHVATGVPTSFPDEPSDGPGPAGGAR
jgi:putative sterol carrier protein